MAPKTVEVSRFTQSVFDAGVAKYEAGKDYPVTEDTKKWERRGSATRETIPAEPEVKAKK